MERNKVMHHFFLEEVQHVYGGALASAFAFVTLLFIAMPFTALVTRGEASETCSREDAPALVKR